MLFKVFQALFSFFLILMYNVANVDVQLSEIDFDFILDVLIIAEIGIWRNCREF